MYQIRESTVDELMGLAQGLFVEHWDEIAIHKRVMRLKPDPAPYKALEAQGLLLILAAFDADDTLVGYSVNYLANHPHYAELVTATNDLLFVTQAHRKSRVGLRLIHETEALARAKGAGLMLWHAKEGTPLAHLMPRLDYGVHDVIFSKEL